jgi:amino-acid N-acetyltransferase
VGQLFTRNAVRNTTRPSFLADQIKVDDFGALEQALQLHLIPVLPPLASLNATHAPEPTNANDLVLALTRYFSGLQLKAAESERDVEDHLETMNKIASVERIIILDPLGGIPMSNRPDIPHRFINLEQEYQPLTSYFLGKDSEKLSTQNVRDSSSAKIHASNLHLTKEALSILPSTSSALITTPYGAANSDRTDGKSVSNSPISFDDMVTTRRKQNPLLYNLLTDKPVFSSSLPTQRMQPDANVASNESQVLSSAATLVKRGMPVTIYPDPRVNPWQPPKPGSPRLRLTDRCIDLPRLMYLIEDSFNRKIDVQDYLNRVNENLAGVIIAGEYEGGAILTWERPPGMSEEEAYESGRMVPYLDKFAVLKSRQGSGGVADIVFNAMVRDCFPEGVCWRSRKDNPVNKWYFERSRGTEVLMGSNWKMFWTTPGFLPGDTTHTDYEAVCRAVEPSWADNKHILD